jgi:hypothetical protein
MVANITSTKSPLNSLLKHICVCYFRPLIFELCPTLSKDLLAISMYVCMYEYVCIQGVRRVSSGPCAATLLSLCPDFDLLSDETATCNSSRPASLVASVVPVDSHHTSSRHIVINFVFVHQCVVCCYLSNLCFAYSYSMIIHILQCTFLHVVIIPFVTEWG